MADDFEIVGRITVDSSGNAQIQALTGHLGDVQKGIDGVSEAHDALGRVATFVWAELIVKGIEEAISAIKEFVSSTIDAAMENEDALANLNATLKSTKGAAGMTADELVTLSESLADVTRFSHDTILQGENMLLTFTKIGKDVFPMATQSLLDLAAKMHSDPEKAAIQLGKALNDPITGVGALRRVGVMLTDQQEDAVKHFMRLGDVESAQKIILGELNTEFGGMAEAMGGTTAGRMEILKNKFTDLKEQIGGAFLPVLAGAATGVIDFLQSAPVKAFFENFLAGIESVTGPITQLVNRIALFGLSGVLKAKGAWSLKDMFHVPPEVIAALQPLVESVQNLIAVINEKGPMVKQTLSDMWNALATAVESAIPTILANIKTVLDTITRIWRDHGDEIMTEIKWVWTILVNIISGAVQFIAGIIAAAFQLIAGLMDTWTAIRAGNWQKAWESIVATLRSVGTTLWNTIRSVLDQFAKLFGTSLDGIVATWKSIFQMLPTVVSIEWDKLMTTLTTLWNKVKAAVTKWKDDMLDAAHKMIDGFIQGLKDKIQDVIKAMKEIIQKAIDAALAKLGISSPSKVFIDVGYRVNQGFAEGLKKSMMLPVDTMMNISGAVTGAGSTAGGGSMALGGVTININGAGDPAAVARAVMAELNNRLKMQGVQPFVVT